jgi:2-polyprenyl-3-methyl-5-hydroxy-6-metoxy-1,4-benzoquinol methylase
MAADPLVHQETLYRSANPTRRRLHRQRRNLIIRLLRDCGPAQAAGRTGLEVGPGSCTYLPTLLELCSRVTAADVEPAFLARARQLAEGEPRLAAVPDDIARSALPAGHFSLILCSEVIEHIADSRPALAGLARLLRPGGRLVLSTPQRRSAMECCARIALAPGVIHLARLVYGESVEPTGHINLLTVRQLERQFAAAGLRIVRRALSGLYLPLIAEFGGLRGARWLARREAGIADSRLSWLLWTQAYVLERADDA